MFDILMPLGEFVAATKIQDVLGDRPLLSVGPTTTLRAVAGLLTQNRVGAVAVVQDDGLVGLVTERDIVFRCIGVGGSVDAMTAEDVMTKDLTTVGINEPISEALANRIGGPFRHLPVMDGDTPIGILSYRDIPAEHMVLFERFREMRRSRANGYER
jgi:CBS domain-containing protein